MRSFEGSFRNLKFSPTTSILLNFFFPVIDINQLFFFSSLKLQYCRTIVLLNKLKLFKETSFSKQRWSCDFPPRKDGILHARSGCLGTPLPFPQSLYGWVYADVTTKISRIDRLPNLLSNGAPLAGCAHRLH